MASCTLQDWSWEEPGAPCCLAGPICLTRSGCFDTTWGFPSPNWHAANGCILALTQSTTRSSAQRISPFLSPVSFRSRQDGRFTSPCAPRLYDSLADRAFGVGIPCEQYGRTVGVHCA